MIEIDIQNEDDYAIDEEALRRAAITVLTQHQRTEHHALTIVLTDDDTVAELNTTYRSIPAPTDVLSFPAEPMPAEIAGDVVYLGDLIIAHTYTAAQATREGHAIDDTLSLLVVHGTLHLLGYDHDTPENRATMWAAQGSALTTLGIPTNIVPALEDSPHKDD